MRSLDRSHRRTLEATIRRARRSAEAGARQALEHIGVAHHEPRGHLTPEQRSLRNRLRARARQLGDKRDARGTQDIERLIEQCAYEHWHRVLFARFLAENGLLFEPSSGVPISLDDCRELAAGQGKPWVELASEYAVTMLPQVFRLNDPLLELQLPAERRAELETLLEAIPPDVFTADDSLGWTYQFWQADAKEAVNATEVKIGARELAPVTQLFTEDYMVDFLLDNTLGAWWAGKLGHIEADSEAEARARAGLAACGGLASVEWQYLRFVRDEEGKWKPASGTFDGWPREAREITVLDPCMGSGHFLVFALPLLARMRMEEEKLSAAEAIDRALHENLFGLELDERCTQIAAFNLALAAWRLAGYRQLPRLNLACSGLSISAAEEEWVALAGNDTTRRAEMKSLYQAFSKAPMLGSLIDPGAIARNTWADSLGGRAQEALFDQDATGLASLLDAAVLQSARNDSLHELAVTASGVARASGILGGQFTLVATNVPYLGRGKQSDELKEYLERHHGRAKADLATCFVERCLAFCSRGASVAAVSPQSWWNQPAYKSLRVQLRESALLGVAARLGAKAFHGISGERVNVGLSVITNQKPGAGNAIALVDADSGTTPEEKAKLLRIAAPSFVSHSEFREELDGIVRFGDKVVHEYLSEIAYTVQGFATSDNAPYIRAFWELPAIYPEWIPALTAPEASAFYGGRHHVLLWENGNGRYKAHAQRLRAAGRLGGWKSGAEAWGRQGVVVAEMGNLAASVYLGEMFDHTAHALIPKDPKWLPAIWCFVTSDEFAPLIKNASSRLNITNETLVKVPFEQERWLRVAKEQLPEGLPAPFSACPTQWLFSGDPSSSTRPLQVAVARLVNFHWPRQTGSEFRNCPSILPDRLDEHEDPDGLVCLPALHRDKPAAQALRSLLAAAYGNEWDMVKERELLAEVNAAALDEWLRDEFFAEHCKLFHDIPFVWHIWDGLNDGFSALVNYHKLAASNGEGRRSIEKLTHTYLGDWITRQQAAVAVNEEGADARLAAAVHLQNELLNILAGEPPYDIFVRWKPLHEQPIGWEPDINDGVRVNIRPFMMAKPLNARGRNSCILRVTPKISWGKDRGKEPERSREDYPWFWGWDGRIQDFDGGPSFQEYRWNDLHYTRERKERARREHAARTEAARP